MDCMSAMTITAAKPPIWLNRGVLLGLLLACLIFVLLVYPTDNPVESRAPETAKHLNAVKNACERSAKDLKRANIDGKGQYDSVRRSMESCIRNLQRVLAEGTVDEAQIKKWLTQLSTDAEFFRVWADMQLRREHSTISSADLSSCSKEVAEAMNDSEPKRREALAKALEQYQLVGWN